MPSIADLFITVSSDVSGALNGLSEVDTKTKSLTGTMQAAAPAGFALAGAAGAIGAGFVDAIGTASSFESAMSGINAVMTPGQVQQYGGALHDLALTLGAETKYSALEAAGAIEELVKAGVPIEAVMENGAKSALALAAATGTDVRTAAEVTSTAMNTYHIAAEGLTHVTDQLTGVTNASAAGMHDLQQALSALGPVAASLNISFDDVSTALGIFANNGLKGSDAGTSLKTMLLNLEPSTKSQVAAFKELGLFTVDNDKAMQVLTTTLQGAGDKGMAVLAKASSDGVVTLGELFKATKALNPQLVDGAKSSDDWARSMGLTSNAFFDAGGNAKSMGEIFGILQTATANLTQEQKVNLLQTAFGTDAVRAALIAATEGAAGWDKLAGAVSAAGDSQVAAKTRMDNLAGSTEQLNGSIETAKIAIGERFLPVLRQFTDAATSIVNGFLALPEGVQTTIVVITAATAVFTGLVGAFILLTPLVASAAAGFGVLAVAAAPIAIPLLAIVAAVGLLYAAWQTDFGGIREVTAEVVAAVQPGLENIRNFISAIGDTLGPAFGAASDASAPFIQSLSVLVGQWLQPLPGYLRNVGDQLNTLAGALQQATSAAQEFAIAIGLQDRLNAVANALNTILGPLAGIVQQMGLLQNVNPFGSLFQLLTQGPFIAALNLMNTIFGNLYQWLIQISGVDLSGLQNALDQIGTTVTSTLADIFAGGNDIFGPFIQQAWEIAPRLGDAFANFLGFIPQALGEIPNIIANLGDLWEPFITSAWNIGAALGDAFGNVLGFIGEALSGIPNLIVGLGDLFGPLVAAAWGVGSQIGDAIQNVLGFLVESIGGIPGWLASFDIFGPIIDAARALLGRLGDAIAPIKQLLADTFGNFWQFLTGAITLPTAGGGGGGTAGGPAPIPTGGSAPLISIGTLVVSSPEEAQAFLQMVADAILASAQRVTPPVGGANPALG